MLHNSVLPSPPPPWLSPKMRFGERFAEKKNNILKPFPCQEFILLCKFFWREWLMVNACLVAWYHSLSHACCCCCWARDFLLVFISLSDILLLCVCRVGFVCWGKRAADIMIVALNRDKGWFKYDTFLPVVSSGDKNANARRNVVTTCVSHATIAWNALVLLQLRHFFAGNFFNLFVLMGINTQMSLALHAIHLSSPGMLSCFKMKHFRIACTTYIKWKFPNLPCIWYWKPWKLVYFSQRQNKLKCTHGQKRKTAKILSLLVGATK